jgi:dTDP-4-dehydrorhamnose 3,5-epimerase
MKIIETKLPGVLIIEPKVFNDSRGYFVEIFRQDLFEKAIGYQVDFVQDNESKSNKGVLRGLHYQLPPYAQAKLIRVIKGSILDVVVDIRKSSHTYGKHVSVKLTSERKSQIFIPHGFAHGFIVTSDSAILSYKMDGNYMPEYERGIAFNDKDLAIDWKLPSELFQISDKDRHHPTLENSRDLFE